MVQFIKILMNEQSAETEQVCTSSKQKIGHDFV